MGKVTINLQELMRRKAASEGRDPVHNPITQMELADRTGIPQTTISRWVGNRVDRIDLGLLDKFCRYFECGVQDILLLKDE